MATQTGPVPSVEFGPRMGYTRRQGVVRSAGPSPARRTIVKVGIALNMLTKEGLSDAAVLGEHMALGVLAEPLGFDSLWALVHHFTGYAMSPAPTQRFIYYSRRTRRITHRADIIVLPRHD